MTARGRLAAAIVVLLALTAAVQMVRDRVYARAALDRPLLYVRSGTVMSRLALSYDDLLADLYWIRALQHYGRERLKVGPGERFPLLYPMLDLTTTLDPRFTIAYRFGALFLAEPQPGGAGRPDLAIALLEKGVAAEPQTWDYYHDIGFIYYWNLHDYQRAAEWFRRGGAQPGAPWWLNTYAAVMLTRGGDRQASRTMWTELGGRADNDWLRRTAALRLAQLDALDQIDALEQRLAAHAAGGASPARTWEDLVAAGVLRGIPLDPAGVPYTFDFATGTVSVPRWSPLYPLPTEPRAAPEIGQRR